jgi:hypothetical protein
MTRPSAAIGIRRIDAAAARAAMAGRVDCCAIRILRFSSKPVARIHDCVLDSPCLKLAPSEIRGGYMGNYGIVRLQLCNAGRLQEC